MRLTSRFLTIGWFSILLESNFNWDRVSKLWLLFDYENINLLILTVFILIHYWLLFSFIKVMLLKRIEHFIHSFIHSIWSIYRFCLVEKLSGKIRNQFFFFRREIKWLILSQKKRELFKNRFPQILQEQTDSRDKMKIFNHFCYLTSNDNIVRNGRIKV